MLTALDQLGRPSRLTGLSLHTSQGFHDDWTISIVVTGHIKRKPDEHERKTFSNL